MISVIVPIYNVEKYLERCVNSILNQTYKNIEIILVNDGSPDQCLNICKKYKNTDKRIKIIDKKNGGLSSARNAGLDIAQGEYISFIDSDDWIEMDFLEVLRTNLIKSDSDIAQCEFKKVYDNNIKNKDLENKTYNTEKISNIKALENLYNENYISTVVFWNKLYKKEIFTNLRFKEGIINEDEDLIYKVLYKSKSIINVKIKLYNYLIREDSIMGESINYKKLDIIEIMQERILFFKSRKLELLEKLTLQAYFRILIDLGSKIYYSDLGNKNEILYKIMSKIDSNKKTISKFSDNNILIKLFLLTYSINPKVPFYLNKKLLQVKNRIGKSR